MKLNPKTWLATMAIIAVALAGWNFVGNLQEKPVKKPEVTRKDQAQKIRASVTINPGIENQVLSVQEIEVEKGSTALDLTQQVAVVETSGEGEMAFVTSIDGRAADSSKNEFWELVINGEPSQVGAGSYLVQEGDKIEWRISTY